MLSSNPYCKESLSLSVSVSLSLSLCLSLSLSLSVSLSLSLSALRHTLYCCLYRYMKSCGGGDIPCPTCPSFVVLGKTTDLYFMVSFPHQAS